MPKKYFFLFLLLFFFSLSFFFSTPVGAGCNIGGASSQECFCNNGKSVIVSPCCAGGSENGTRWEGCGAVSWR